ncbi:MAG: hypothetical protein A3J10_03585 [Candidatus Sungbacteria bacterium RIFCSPLOWO2_02_FULL_54_10]|nr:MAG: hypothetical protein A3J10_03585 [Candidatus Sungbacteria bacterium RIFCSPLOWO2_02_FULL_54_10]
MADENKTVGDHTGGSNGSNENRTPLAPEKGNTQESDAIAEAHIIEETVVKPPPVDVKAGPPAPPIEAADTGPAAHSPQMVVHAEAAASHTRQATGFIAEPDQPPPHTQTEIKREHENISNILEEVKLPERRGPAPREETATTARVFDTGLRDLEKSVAGATSVRQVEPTARAPEQSTTSGTDNTFAARIVSPLRTLKNDLQEIVREKKISLVRAVALESDKSHTASDDREREHTLTMRRKRILGILFAVAFFLFLGAAAFFGVYFVAEDKAGMPVSGARSSILFSENSVPFPLGALTPLETKRILAGARETFGSTLGAITRIVPIEQYTDEEGTDVELVVSLQSFLERLGARPPDELIRAVSTEFFFGIHTVDENAPLFVIPVTSYERAFAGMLAWEDRMNRDLAPVFSPVPEQVMSASGLPEKRRFADLIMRNYDVRALKDDSGEIELYYSFPTRELLIIAESPYSFTEVLNRLRAERKL